MNDPLTKLYTRLTKTYFGRTITSFLRQFKSPIYWFTLAMLVCSFYIHDSRTLIPMWLFYLTGLLMGHLWW